MAIATSPYSIDRNQYSSGRYINYIYQNDNNAYPLYTYTTNSAWNDTHLNSGHPHWYTYWGKYSSLAYGDYGWALWGSSLPYATEYTVSGNSNVPIITNGHTGATLNFNSAGFLDVTPSDTVNAKATSGTVTIRNDRRYSTNGGYVNAVSGGADTFVVSGTNLHLDSGDGNDNITVSNTGNYISGGSGVDNIKQTVNGDDSIDGGSGNDNITVPDSNHWRVDGGSGDDIITLGSGNTSVFGGADNDKIDGISSNVIHGGGDPLDYNDKKDTITASDSNWLYGDNDADVITARNSNHIYGDSNPYDPTGYGGKDTITAQDGNYVYGGNDADSILVNDSNHVEGNNGSDNIEANDENTIWGGADKDTIFASEYNTVYGGGSGSNADNDIGTDPGGADGADSIKVEVGNLVYGGAGEDVIEAKSANLIFGGEGKDTITAAAKDSIGGGDGEDCIKAGEHAYIDAGPDNDNVKADFNSSIWGAGGNDTVDATDTNYIDGGDGDDNITATDDNTIYGGSGKDTITVKDGNMVWGDWGDGRPATIVSGWTDSLNNVNTASYTTFTITHNDLQGLKRYEGGDAGNDTIIAGDRNTMHGGWGEDSIIGTDLNLAYGDVGNDTIYLKSHNSIWGGAGSDIIHATDFNLIYGDNVRDGADPGAGDDSIVARTDSTIYGGAGKDTIIADDAAKIDGGTGNDSISFGMNSSILAGEGDDTIVSQAPGSPTAPNGSNGSTIWGGKGKVDKFGHPIHYETSGGKGTDSVTGAAFTAKSPGVHDAHGHNVFTGEDALVTIMDFKFGNDVIHFGKAFEASAVTAFGYGNSTIVPTTDYQIYTAGTDRINVAATISDAANIDMRDETGKFVMFGNPNGTLKGGFANTLLGGKNDDTIYVGEGDYVYGGLGNDTINLNGYNNWRDHVGLTEEGGTDTITSFQQGWGEGDDVVWYNVPLRKQVVDDKGNAMTDADHRPIYTDTNTDAVADLNDANVRVVGDKTVLSQGKSKLILNGVTHGEILIEDGEGVHRTALLGEGYFNDSTRGGQIFIGRKEYSDIVSFEKNNHDLVVDLGMTKRFKDKSAKFYSIEQAIGGSGNNTLVGAKNVRNTLEGGVGTSSIWGGGISADLMVSGTGSATDHYTTFFYGTGDGDDTIEGFRTTERTEAHFKRDILDIHSGDVTSVRKVGTSIVLNMSGRTDRLTIRNAASGLFDQLIEVNVMGKKGAAKVTGANEVVTYDPHAQYYFSNAKAGGTVRNFGDNSRIYLDGRTGDVYKGITNIDVSAGSRLELAGDASNNRIIYRGTGTASLYGGLGNDTMTGSKDGTNRFFFGRSDGNDVITNSTVNDKVMLYDVALEDVVSAKETNGTMRIALKSGARLAIQNFDAKSVHDFTLATGDTWVYNHNATGTGGYWSPKGNYPVQPKS